MKLNGWLQIIVLLLGMTGLVTWIITADTRLHTRCDRLDVKIEKTSDTMNKNYVELIELKGDVSLVREILELRYPEIAKEARKNNQ